MAIASAVGLCATTSDGRAEGYVGVSRDWSCMDAASKQYRHKMRGCYGKQSRRMEKRQPVKRTELCAFFAETRLNSDRSKIVPVVRSFFILLMSTFVLRGVLSSGMSCL